MGKNENEQGGVKANPEELQVEGLVSNPYDQEVEGEMNPQMRGGNGRNYKEMFSEGITKLFEPLEKFLHKNNKDTTELETQKKSLLTSLGKGWGEFSSTLGDVQKWAEGKLKNAQKVVNDMQGKANTEAHKFATNAERAWEGFVNSLGKLQEKAQEYAQSAQTSVVGAAKKAAEKASNAAGEASRAVHDVVAPKLQAVQEYAGEKRAQFNQGVEAGKKSHAEKVQAERDAKQAAQIEGAPQGRGRH